MEPVDIKDMIPEDIDEELTEEDALAQASAEGIEFVDFYMIDGKPEEYATQEEAEEAAEEGDRVLQCRKQKPKEE